MGTDYNYDDEYGNGYTYATYEGSGDVKKPDTSEGTDLNYDFTNEEIRNSPDDSSGEDLNKYSKDAGSEQLDSVLDNFKEDNWNDLSLEDQKQSMTHLADCVASDTENENPPEIVFRADMADGSYGGYNPETNTMEINENMLDNSAEAADTIAHEMWHAHQHQCVLDPASEKGQEYQEGFDNYISPEYDFEGYENQMVEAEAREYAQGFKDKLKGTA
jgi:predicted SprT family Zn-dependent metalloprotease